MILPRENEKFYGIVILLTYIFLIRVKLVCRHLSKIYTWKAFFPLPVIIRENIYAVPLLDCISGTREM